MKEPLRETGEASARPTPSERLRSLITLLISGPRASSLFRREFVSTGEEKSKAEKPRQEEEKGLLAFARTKRYWVQNANDA
jgi:hypothetical protein